MRRKDGSGAGADNTGAFSAIELGGLATEGAVGRVQSFVTGRWWMVRSARLLAAACVLGAAHRADAFEVKHTSSGQAVRWTSTAVAFVVDPSVEAAVPGSMAAIQAALSGWSSVKGAPSLSVSATATTSKPSNDGQNTIYFAEHGDERASGALAITILTFDDNTGDILDTDIVINGRYDFAVLGAGATPDPDAQSVSTEGGGQSDDGEEHGAHSVFDLCHVVAHETGHGLGLKDETDDESALMYLFSKPGDASHRAPAADDLAGVNDLYASSAAAQPGCSAMIAPRGPSGSMGGALAFMLGAVAWRRTSRLRRRRDTNLTKHVAS